MKILGILILLMIAAGAAAYFLMPTKKAKRHRFMNSGPLLSGKATEIYAQIENTLGPQYKVFPKIPLKELIMPDPRLPEKDRETTFAPFTSTVIDFCVFDAETMETICCIMVPRTLAIEQAVMADKALKSALTQAGIDLVHIKPSADLSKSSIYKRLKHIIEKNKIGEEPNPATPDKAKPITEPM
jgi:hypothetical protein